MLTKTAKNARKKDSEKPVKFSKVKKLAAEGIICLAMLTPACGGQSLSEDAGMDSDTPARIDSDVIGNDPDHRDADMRMDVEMFIDARPDAIYDMEVELPPCPEPGCATESDSNPELRVDIGGSSVVGGIRMTGVSNDGPVGYVDLHCDENGELLAENVPLPLNSTELVSNEIANVEMMCFGILGDTRLFINVSVTPKCR
ncbi:MAG: hypothetical protein ABH983_05580 [Candidatus Micrarchaeota archaeon]